MFSRIHINFFQSISPEQKKRDIFAKEWGFVIWREFFLENERERAKVQLSIQSSALNTHTHTHSFRKPTTGTHNATMPKSRPPTQLLNEGKGRERSLPSRSLSLSLSLKSSDDGKFNTKQKFVGLV